MDFKYFSSVQGRAVQRYGTDSYIGATKTPKGFVWDVDRVVAEARRPYSWAR